MNELQFKLDQVQSMLAAKELDALYLQRAASFAWATSGASSYINTADSNGLASVLITADGHYILTTNIEEPRVGGEVGLTAAGWDVRGEWWYEDGVALAELTSGLRVGADAPLPGMTDLSGEMAVMRATLTQPEQERMRAVSQLSAAAMDAAVRAVRPGMTEYEIAALLAAETQKRGVQGIVNLIATDERIFNYRHPLPTAKVMGKYAMLVLCGRQYGLVPSITRLVHFGPLSDELRTKMEATAFVDAAFIAATRPGRTLGAVLADAQDAYATTGYADEWQLHHQGGPAGYEPREYIATPGNDAIVVAGQTYAWNPSITGTKSEDTIIVGEDGNEVLTIIDGWPMIDVEIDGIALSRPAILEIL